MHSASGYQILLLQRIMQWKRQLWKQAIQIKRLSTFTLINRLQLWACEKQLKSIELRRKNNIPTIFIGVGGKNNNSLLFKMSMIGGKRKNEKRLLQKITRLHKVLPRNQVTKTNFLSSCKETSVLCLHGLENMLFLYLSLFPISERWKQ